MTVAQYQVIVLEHDSSPWDDGHLFTRTGAWARVQSLARLVVPGWPHPIRVRVWRTRPTRVLVYDGDLRELRQ
jgi:hypothetical protein